MKKFLVLFTLVLFAGAGCSGLKKTTDSSGSESKAPFVWDNANIYFMLTDRFNNGDPNNDLNFYRNKETGKLRGFMGGDMKGIVQKIEEGYFDELGVTALWFTPVVEQIYGDVDEGTGTTYAFHGYWAKDWTSFDPNFGTAEDLKLLVEKAHARGIRILLDVVINHTGPVTPKDPVWPDGWVRTAPKCQYTNYENTITCTLVDNLPDVKTDSDTEVGIPKFLEKKWRSEGRFEKEKMELDAFFNRTGYPRAPRFYIIKWLTDYIRKYGIDGFRLDTVKHTEETVWKELREEADIAFMEWKKANPKKVLDDNPFYMVGEVYGYGLSGGVYYNFGEKKVNYFDNGITTLINFDFKGDATQNYERLFAKYSASINLKLKGNNVVNYISSHDDSSPFDKQRMQPLEAGTKLLLAPGASQIYYGDETARPLEIPGAIGDANLRSFMNWEALANNEEVNGYKIKDILSHWQKLGQFRKNHPAVGAGIHSKISESPYVFKRTFKKGDYKDVVVAGLELPKGKKEINLGNTFENGTELKDYYSGAIVKVNNGIAIIDSEFDIVLLGK